MKPHTASLLNAVVLIAMGLWGYFATESNTAFIPVVFGVGLLLCNNGLRAENKIVSHIAVLLTMVILLALLGMRLPKALNAGGLSMVRTVLPVITGIIAMVAFIKSFRDARKAKTNA